MRIHESAERTVVETAAYRLALPRDGVYATLSGPGSEPWADLLLLASLDRLDGPDDTVGISPLAIRRNGGGCTVEAAARSTIWDDRTLELACSGDEIRARARVRGTGTLASVALFAGSHTGREPLPLAGRLGTARLWSGAHFASVFSPEPVGPDDAHVRSAREPATIDVLGAGLPGQRHWIFTPPPFAFAFARAAAAPDGTAPEGPWLVAGIDAAEGAHRFTSYEYAPRGDGFALRLDYEGHTRVAGTFSTPDVVLRWAPEPYAGLEDHVRSLRNAPRRRPAARAPWWSAPMFCGWGAQCALGGDAKDHARQEHYDRWLAHLAERDVRPGTVVLDDKWQAQYGKADPDGSKWPDLRGWIAARHAADQHVLLWLKAWDREGVDAALCVRNASGEAVTTDPANPAYESHLREQVRRMLAPDELDADGFKIDFTARTPSGASLVGSDLWGLELLRRLLWIVYDEAKRVKPDALVMTHAPHPYLADVADMIRLNDVFVESPVVPQMRHRARVARIACPDALIDTDDWPMRDRAAWREYLDMKSELGVPSLYYATHIDRTGEALGDDDYAAIRAAWERAGR